MSPTAQSLRGVHFVTGIGTDIGKSWMTGLLARALADEGLRVATMKFIQTGCPDGGSIDVDLHRRLARGSAPLPEDAEGLTAPCVFSYPASPHLAARLDGRAIDYAAIDDAMHTIAARYDTLLVEGAGGLMVPLSDDGRLTVDYVAERDLPLIVVTNGRLGAINDTVLTLEAIRSRGLRVSALIYNRFFDGADPVIAADNLAWMKGYARRTLPPGTPFLEF